MNWKEDQLDWDRSCPFGKFSKEWKYDPQKGTSSMMGAVITSLTAGAHWQITCFAVMYRAVFEYQDENENN